MKTKCNEIFKLKEMLETASIPFEFFDRGARARYEYYQICVPKNGKERICSIIEGMGTYGYDQDLLEIMGLLTPEEQEYDSVVGYLTADDVFRRINKHLYGEFHSKHITEFEEDLSDGAMD